MKQSVPYSGRKRTSEKISVDSIQHQPPQQILKLGLVKTMELELSEIKESIIMYLEPKDHALPNASQGTQATRMNDTLRSSQVVLVHEGPKHPRNSSAL